MNTERLRAGMVRLAMAAVLSAAPLGCQGASADASPPPDWQVLQNLDCYNPQYKINEDRRVTELCLSWRHLPADAFAEIDKLTDLELMDLAHTTMTDEGLAQLKDLQKLRAMGLGGTQITDRGLAYLEKMQGLERIWLSKGAISRAAVEKLREARPDITIYGF
ncbi:MAG TPA: hypothetical protein VFE78_31085 [Gemmataceae bacterium]|jgi:hypothetical protein|nr:hypothetical protein [Gemmataceae bacterium]